MTVATDWAGVVGGTWASEWQRTDRSFAELSPALDKAIAHVAPDRGVALDIGCGAGATSLALAGACPDLTVIGADLSSAAIVVARDRGRDRGNLSFRDEDAVAVAQDAGPIDLFVSRHGVMFFADPVAAFTALRAEAREDAALVFSCFRDRSLNPWATEMVAAVRGDRAAVADDDRPGPFAFADPARVGDILTQGGWRDAEAVPVDYRYIAGQGDDAVADAISLFRRIGPAAALLRHLPPIEHEAALARMAQACLARLDRNAVTFPATAWIWRASA